MPIAQPIQDAFNGGIFSPSLAGHVSAPRRASAVSEMQNLIPMVQGPATRRGGTRFAYEVKNSAKQTALLEFEFNVEQAFIVEMGELYMRFYKDNAIITETAATITGITAASPPVVTTGVHGYTTGDEVFIDAVVGMVEVNQRSYHITVLSTTTFSLQDREDVDIVGAGYTAYSSAGTSAKIYEIATSYADADLFDADGHFEFRITQSNDVMYIAHKNYPLSTLIRTTDTSWAVAEVDVVDGPYDSSNTTSTQLKPDGVAGSISLGVNDLNIVANGTFSQISDWTLGLRWLYLPIGAGSSDVKQMHANVQGGAVGVLEQAITFTAGKTYKVTYDVVSTGDPGGPTGVTVSLGGQAGTKQIGPNSPTTHTEDIVAGSSNGLIEFNADAHVVIDNVVVQEIKELVTNGDFGSGSGWTTGTGWSVGSGVATVSGAQTGFTDLETNVTAEKEKSYTLVYTVTAYTAGSIAPFIAGIQGTDRTAAVLAAATLPVTYTEIIIAGAGTDPRLEFRASDDADLSIDNASLKLLELGINNNTGFQSTDVGRQIRLRDTANNWTWVEITSVQSTTSVIADVKGPALASSDAALDWQIGIWSDTTSYPSAVWLYQRRLITGTGDRIDFTQISGFTDSTVDFTPTDPDGTVNADNAIAIRLGADKVNDVLWIADHEKALVCGTAGGEWIVRSTTLGDAIAPDNITQNRATREGSAPAQAVVAGNAVLFIQRARRKLHETGFNFEADGFRSPDMTLLAEDVTNGVGGIVQMAYQQQPQSIVWIVRKDGILLGFTYEREENVIGWHKHVIGGSFGSGDSVVEHVASIPSADTSRDELWMIVKRTINSVTRRYVEYMTQVYDTSIAAEDAVHVDSSLAYSGAAATTVRGLNHLEGETVTILNEAKAQPTAVVAAGLITIPNSLTTTKAQVGLANTWKLQTLELEVAGPGNTMQGKLKRPDRVIIRYLSTLGISISGDDVDYDNEEFTNFTNFGLATDLFTGDVEHRWPGDYDRKGKLYLQHSGAFPATILAMMPRVATSDR